ncbi:hypothetical protein HDU78_003872 [Chytriomyces hyalinus]|nr:hypothetical protein HDU78_003872 [Chytriomyces hyalinus]
MAANPTVIASELLRAVAEKNSDSWNLNSAGKTAAQAGYLLAKHRRFGNIKALSEAKKTMHVRFNGIEEQIQKRFKASVATNSTSLIGGVTSVIGGALLFTPLAAAGAGMIGVGAAAGFGGTVAEVLDSSYKEKALIESWTSITGPSDANDLLQVVHLLGQLRSESEGDACKDFNRLKWVDIICSYYTACPEVKFQEHYEQVSRNMIDGIVAGSRDGSLHQLCDSARIVAEAQERGKVVAPPPLALEKSFVAMFGIASAGMVWAGSFGASMADAMAKVLVDSGFAQAPAFMATYADIFNTVGGSVAILAGFLRIIVSVVAIVYARESRDRYLETVKKGRREMEGVLEAMHSPAVIAI